jgi:hypothetical protein
MLFLLREVRKEIFAALIDQACIRKVLIGLRRAQRQAEAKTATGA